KDSDVVDNVRVCAVSGTKCFEKKYIRRNEGWKENIKDATLPISLQLGVLVPVDVVYWVSSSEAPKRDIEIEAYICIRKMEKIREERKKERETGEKLSKELGNVAWAGDFYFDYCGIRWMTEGRWGMDHPSGDPTGLIWSNPGEIYDYYD
ncbi:hypothetical protein PV326_010586, partial [Microctonus aethiopoides]